MTDALLAYMHNFTDEEAQVLSAALAIVARPKPWFRMPVMEAEREAGARRVAAAVAEMKEQSMARVVMRAKQR